MSNILITSAGRRVELVDSFKTESRKLDKKLKVFCTDLNPELSSACQVADLYFRAPRVTSKKYISFCVIGHLFWYCLVTFFYHTHCPCVMYGWLHFGIGPQSAHNGYRTH